MSSLGRLHGPAARARSLLSLASRRRGVCGSNPPRSSVTTPEEYGHSQPLHATTSCLTQAARLSSAWSAPSNKVITGNHLVNSSLTSGLQSSSQLQPTRLLSQSTVPMNYQHRGLRRYAWLQQKQQQNKQQRAMLSSGMGGENTSSKAGNEGARGRGAGGDASENSKNRTGEQEQHDGRETGEDEISEEEKLGARGVMQLIGFAMVLGIAGVCGYFIVAELFPSKMSPNSVMSNAHEAFLADPDTANHFGTPLKVYGRDNNRHREGRRNFVEHVEYVDPNDSSKRTRVRLNVEGPHGHGLAYAEVSNKMERGEWVYLCVQDMSSGHVITLHDNRAMLSAQAHAGSQEEKDAFAAMLGKRSS